MLITTRPDGHNEPPEKRFALVRVVWLSSQLIIINRLMPLYWRERRGFGADASGVVVGSILGRRVPSWLFDLGLRLLSPSSIYVVVCVYIYRVKAL